MYDKTILNNGARIISQRAPHVKSASIGIWVNTGSRDETEAQAGCSHLVEHMFFKGTKTRDAFTIAKELDQVGGMANAFTSKEQTCFHVKVMSDHIPAAVEVLVDIFLNSVLSQEELERERQVVLQEIGMVEDTPDELIHVLNTQDFWPAAPLGRSILGTQESVAALERDHLLAYIADRYQGGRVLVAAAGDIEHARLTDLVAGALETLPGSKNGAGRQKPVSRQGLRVVGRDLEQAHLCLGLDFPASTSPSRYAAAILSTALGGNMSSRLFQEIREKRGLAYSIYSFLSTYEDAGMFGVYAGVDADDLQLCLALIRAELAKVAAAGLTKDETRAAREYLKGSLVLGLESTDMLMNRLAKNEFLFGRFVPYTNVLEAIDNVSGEELADLASRCLKAEPMVTVLGPVDETPLA